MPDALATLDATHRDVLAVLALGGPRAQSRPRWLGHALEAGVVAARGREFPDTTFQNIVETLVTAGVAVANRSHEYTVHPDWMVPSIIDAHRRGRLAPLADGLRVRARSFGLKEGLGERGELLVALASNDGKKAREVEKAFIDGPDTSWSPRPLRFVEVLGLEPPRAWLSLLSSLAIDVYMKEAAQLAFMTLGRLGPAVIDLAPKTFIQETRALFAMLLALSGDQPRAVSILEEMSASPWTQGARGFVALVAGDVAEARKLFASARGQKGDLPGVLALFDALLAATSDRGDDVADIERRLVKASRALPEIDAASAALDLLAHFRTRGVAHDPGRPSKNWIDAFVQVLVVRWMKGVAADRIGLEDYATLARTNGYVWLADEMDRASRGAPHGGLLALFGNKQGWELGLDSLRTAASAIDDAEAFVDPAATRKDSLVWWTLTLEPEKDWIGLDAYLVTPRAARGSKIAAKRLAEGAQPGADEQDQRIAEVIVRLRDLGRELVPSAVMLPLVGHPRVRDGEGRHLSIVLAEPRLDVQKTPEGARIALVPSTFDRGGVGLAREEDRILVYRETPAAARIRAALPAAGLTVPDEGLARMYEVLGAVGGDIPVSSEAFVPIDTATEPGDPRIHVQLFRAGETIRTRIRVVPGGTSGPALRPGAPPAEAVVPRDGRLVRVVRDLGDESERLARLADTCPTLASLPQDGADGVARDVETCLELLVELRDAEADVVVDWLAGQPLRAPIVRNPTNVRIRVKGDGALLTVDGGLVVDESRVIGMTELLEASSRARGRFLPIGDDEYVALTDALRKKLEGLQRVQRLSKDGRIPAALLGVDGLWDDLDVSFSASLEKRRAALEDGRELDIAVPHDLTAELRDYQRDGFLFLARRTEGGLGACLADDMGLGKTVQAIALLLHRRAKGPALVIVPTSVRRNWESELAKFAPSLDIERFGDGVRSATIATAGAGTVVLVTYGLLVAEDALLASRTWGTIVFDEAHALKNAATQRWSAARGLHADAIVALTGTPVENQAGELHALFDLLLPGMLGTRKTFDRAFGLAIANGEREATNQLRQIIRPFILRRTKGEVLAELPPRTEITQIVMPSPEQLAFCEAIRRKALETLASAQKAKGAGAARARIELLAEITRLRRAAIDPRLVGGDTAPPGTKIDALVELVTELKAEGRRALVFSQFLEVLDLARTAVEKAGIECLRLDGTMSESARADAVAAFQAGRADIFLVSLKAGGVGMNLTAADFVVFLDPWWNPAVEDQATGRAHRMGQERPVTVARLITEQTIEEKILALHAKKRKLYEDIVSGADGAGTLSVDAIGALLEE